MWSANRFRHGNLNPHPLPWWHGQTWVYHPVAITADSLNSGSLGWTVKAGHSPRTQVLLWHLPYLTCKTLGTLLGIWDRLPATWFVGVGRNCFIWAGTVTLPGHYPDYLPHHYPMPLLITCPYYCYYLPARPHHFWNSSYLMAPDVIGSTRRQNRRQEQDNLDVPITHGLLYYMGGTDRTFLNARRSTCLPDIITFYILLQTCCCATAVLT